MYLAALCNRDTCRQPGGGSQFYPLLAGLLHILSLSLPLHICKVRMGSESDSSGVLHKVTHIGPICKWFFPSAVGREAHPRSLSRLVRALHEVSAQPGSRPSKQLRQQLCGWLQDRSWLGEAAGKSFSAAVSRMASDKQGAEPGGGGGRGRTGHRPGRPAGGQALLPKHLKAPRSSPSDAISSPSLRLLFPWSRLLGL